MNFNVNQIVKGAHAGTFVILGFRTIGGEQCAQLKPVNPDNHAEHGAGELSLPLDSIVSLERATYAAELVQELNEIGDVRQGDSILKVDGTSYALFKSRGLYKPHLLDIANTSPLRLLAHWEAFTGRTLTVAH